jgi:hypothetical protein
MIHTITQSNIRMHAYTQGDDVKVLLFGSSVKHAERWFSKYTHLNESFSDASFRVFTRLASEHNTKIISMQGSK